MLLLPKTTVYICKVCRVQKYERTLFGKPVPIISQNEVDELGSHAKWQQEHGEPHYPHKWKKVEKSVKDVLTN